MEKLHFKDFTNEVLVPFNRAVNNGQYKLLTYDSYKKLYGRAKVDIRIGDYTVFFFNSPIELDKPITNTTSDDRSLGQYICDTYLNIEKNNNEENETMKNNFMNFDFGPCTNDGIKVSLYGIAVKNTSGNYVSYDSANKNIIDVDILNFDGGKYLFKMPVAIKDVQIGDTIIHARKPMFVEEVKEKSLVAVDPVAGEKKEVLLTKSPFGFDFATKIVNLFASMGGFGGADNSNPFGNMLPFFLMGDSKGGDRDMMLMFAMMNGNTNFAANPMLMYALMNKDGKANDMLPFLLMGGFGANPAGCCGNCSCDKEN